MVKLLGRLRKKKSSYVDVESHSKVKDAVKQWDNIGKSSSKALKEGDREQLNSLSTRSMSTLQKGQIPWNGSDEKTTQMTTQSAHIRETREPIATRVRQFTPNHSTTHARTSNNMMVTQVNKSHPVQAKQPQASRPLQIHPPVVREMSKPNPPVIREAVKPINMPVKQNFDEEALDSKYDLIPTKVRNAPFGRCYFARHKASRNVVLIALILQHVFDRFQGEHGEVQLIELMKSADPNLRGLREKIQCSGSVALVMDITLNDFSKSETMPHHNGAGFKAADDPSIEINGEMDQRDEEDEVDDFMSELDSQNDSPWTPNNATSSSQKVDPRKKKIDSEHFKNGAFSFESYEQAEKHEEKTKEKPKVAEKPKEKPQPIEKPKEKPSRVQPERRDPTGREESHRADGYISADSSEHNVVKSKNDRQPIRQSRSKNASKGEKKQYHVEMREESDEVRELPDETPRSRGHRARAQSADRRSETREKTRRRRQKELGERRHGRTSSKSRGRDRIERSDSYSTTSSDTTSVVLRPMPPKNLTFWKLLTSLELADCMPLAALDETMDFNYGRDESSRRSGRRIERRNTFDTCDSSAY